MSGWPNLDTSFADPRPTSSRDGIYELRVGLSGRNYRMLYFFHGQAVAILSHGLVKQRAVSPGEIDRALERKRKFEADPKRHTYEEA